jgi:hypothetical protein
MIIVAVPGTLLDFLAVHMFVVTSEGKLTLENIALHQESEHITAHSVLVAHSK